MNNERLEKLRGKKIILFTLNGFRFQGNVTTQTSILSKIPSWMPRFALWLIIVVAVLLAIGYIYQLRTTAADVAQVPPSGERVDVGGYSLHIHCTGDGAGPTIVVEAGAGDFSTSWTGIQREVEKSARICTYGRAGYGWSDLSPHPHTATQISEELHQLLINAKVEPPYILVGHSLGGMTIRMFAELYPDEVAGMVLGQLRLKVLTACAVCLLSLVQSIATAAINSKKYF